MKILKKISLLILLVSGLLYSCKENPREEAKSQTTEITGKLNPSIFKKLQLQQIASDIHEEIELNTDGTLAKSLNIKQADVFTIKHRRDEYYTFLKPGETIQLKGDPKDSLGIILTGDLSPENKYLQQYADIHQQIYESGSFRNIAKLEPSDFLAQYERRNHPLDSLMTVINKDNQLDAKFKKLLRLRLDATKAKGLIEYPLYYKYLNKKEVVLPKDYFAPLKKLDYDNTDLLAFGEGLDFGKTLSEKGLNYEDFDKDAKKYYQALIANTKKVFTTPLLQKFFSYLFYKDILDFGGGLDEVGDELNSFMASTDNQFIINSLKKTIAPLEKIRKGKPAPDFEGVTRDGKLVKLSDLKGKNVYVDVWATWCGPCIGEIPSLKKVEKKYHNKNITFVSISIDKQRDKEKWKNFIKEKNLSGTQIMADKAWNSAVVKEYNIKGIPRFILVDADGKILSSNAPRPSSKSLIDMFEENGI